MKLKTLFYLFLVGLFLTSWFSGCLIVEDGDVWKIIDDSFAYRAWNFRDGETNQTLYLYRLKPENFNIKILNSTDKPKYVSDWFYNADGPEIVINGSYFHEDYSPSGYLKINFERIGEKIFDQNQSGLLQIEKNKISIRDLSQNPLKEGENVEYGLQSYPFMIKNSMPAINEDTEKIARRTAVGFDNEGNFYIIIADLTHISLYKMMNELQNTGIAFTDVLNLDGGTSSGIAIDTGNFREVKDSLVKVPNVVVFDKI